MGRVIAPRSSRKRDRFNAKDYTTSEKNRAYDRMDADQSLIDISRETLIHRNTSIKMAKAA